MQKMTASPVATVASPTAGDERGAAAIEYGIMIALISAVLIATLALTGNNLNALFHQVTYMFVGM